MDILIKSFNRPYYLDRCIKSIYKNICGDYNVIIIDDGTPSIYLDKIVSLYPSVKVIKSDFYDLKSSFLAEYNNRESRFPMAIPSKFWFQVVSQASDIFLLIEDDIWITEKINVDEVLAIMRSRDMIMLKLSWLGNKSLISGKYKAVNSSYGIIRPSIPYISQISFLDRFKKLHARGILYRLGLIHDDQRDYHLQLPFYTLYTVASAFFDKNYWMYLWADSGEKVNEDLQIRRAAEWFLNKKNQYGKSAVEMTKTSFITSATNEYEDINLDIYRFNDCLNKAWFYGHLDAMQNFPNDFEMNYIIHFLDLYNHTDASSKEWKKWVEKFRNQYRASGCEVD